MVRQFTVIDLFCGAGGLMLGFKMAKYKNFGFKVIAAARTFGCQSRDNSR